MDSLDRLVEGVGACLPDSVTERARIQTWVMGRTSLPITAVGCADRNRLGRQEVWSPTSSSYPRSLAGRGASFPRMMNPGRRDK